MALCLGVYINDKSDLFASAVQLLRGGHELFVGQSFAAGFHRMFFVCAVVGRSDDGGEQVNIRMSMPFATRFEAEAQLLMIFDYARKGG